MFGKFKDKLKKLFVEESEDLIEDETNNEETKEEVKEIPKTEKKKKSIKENKPEETKKKEELEVEDLEELPKVEEIKTESKSKEEKNQEEPKVEKETPQVEKKTEELPKIEEIGELPQIEEATEEEPKKEKKGFFSKVFGKKETENLEEAPKEIIEPKIKEENLPEETKIQEIPKEEGGLFSKTFGKLTKKTITQNDFEEIWVELEIFLLEINVAYEIVEKIGEELKTILIDNKFDRFSLSKKIREVMTHEVEKVLETREAHFFEEITKEKPYKIMVLGVNGTGKTTSIGKVIQALKKNNLKVVVAAADTFRAAAVEQLEEHCKNLDTKLIKHSSGSDPAAVAFDAVEHAKAKGIDVVLIDTAGRMPNNHNLVMELQKIKRVTDAQMNLFIGDSISGNDLLEQIELFDKGVGIDGVILTKVDTDEKPGSIVTTAYSIEKPIYFLGHGQTYDDLTEFKAKEIAEKLFSLE